MKKETEKQTRTMTETGRENENGAKRNCRAKKLRSWLCKLCFVILFVFAGEENCGIANNSLQEIFNGPISALIKAH